MKNLYHVQDGDRPMYVIAKSWLDAIDFWKAFIASENNMKTCDVEEPTGIHLVAEEEELLIM